MAKMKKKDVVRMAVFLPLSGWRHHHPSSSYSSSSSSRWRSRPTRSGPIRSLLLGVLVAHHQHPATVSSQNTIARIRRHVSASYCRERAGLDFDLLGYPSRPAAQAPPFPHHQYSHHHNDQHVSTMNVSTMTIPAALAPPLPTSYI